MCLYLNKDSEYLKQEIIKSGKPVICYKILRVDLRSPHFPDFRWKFGLNESGRVNTDLTLDEERYQTVDIGLHFFLQKCPVLNPCRYQYQYRCLYRNPHRCPYQCLYPLRGACHLRQFKCEIQPKDIIAINNEEIVATKATLISEI